MYDPRCDQIVLSFGSKIRGPDFDKRDLLFEPCVMHLDGPMVVGGMDVRNVEMEVFVEKGDS